MEAIDILLNQKKSVLLVLVIAALLMFLGPGWVKRQYLSRNNISVDEEIEDRNSWILYPKKYNTLEKGLMVLIYVSAFILGVVALVLSQ